MEKSHPAMTSRRDFGILFRPWLQSLALGSAALILSAELSSLRAEQPYSSGSGFIVHADGYILTSQHVIDGADKIEVVLSDGTQHSAKVVAVDEAIDVALLKVARPNLPTAILGDSEKMDVTDYVMAIGHPLASSTNSSASAYEGKINAKRTDQGIARFQIDATINPGISGGPLVNERGEVIAIIESKLSAEAVLLRAGFIPERISFALPIHLAQVVLKKADPVVRLPGERTKLEPKAIFNLLKPCVVLVLNYRSVKIGLGGLSIAVPGIPVDAKLLDLVPVGSGEERFLMGKYEVTQAQFFAMMGENPSQFRYGPDYPVDSVSWEEAKKFCTRLTALVRSAASEAGNAWPTDWDKRWAFRLPTDEEWSRAVGLEKEEGATPKDKDMKIKGVYPWGAEWPPPSRAGNFADRTCRQKHPGIATVEGYEDGYAETAPVGSFKPNKYGLCDLGGNMWEWCEDWLDQDQKQRVLRGGSWRNGSPDGLLSSHRASNTPTGRFHNIGFRVVLGGSTR